MIYCITWNTKTNEIVEQTAQDVILETEKELEFWNNVVKYTKVERRRKKAENWIKYLEEIIDRARRFQEAYENM